MEKYQGNTVEYWKQNAEEDYLTTPISVLKYITVLEEQAEQLCKHGAVVRREQLKALLEKLLNENMCSVAGDELIKDVLKGF
jgi:hypothetical protein